MNINELDNFWFTYINIPVDSISEFIINNEVARAYQIKYEYINVDEFYLNSLHLHSSLDFYAVLYFRPRISPEKTIAIGNAGSWGTLSNFICKHLSGRNIQFDINDSMSGVLRNTLICNESGKPMRFVQSLFSDEEDEWIFTEKGDPLEFEDLDNYLNPDVSARLNKSVLIKYCKNLDLNIENHDFFRSDEKVLYVRHEIKKK